MQIVMEQTLRSRQDLKKRVSSANFNSKKIRTILSSRQTCDEITIVKGKQDQVKNDVSQKTIDIAKKKGRKIQPHSGELKVRKVQDKILSELIKPIKYDKTPEQSLLMKNCDKTKLIFWNKQIPITGNEKYLILSADLIIDQDYFWDRFPSDNGNFPSNTLNNSNTLATLNHNSAQTYRSRNNFIDQRNGQGKYLGGGSAQMLSNAFQKGKNPLLSSNKLTSLIKEWKALHSRSDSQNRKLIVFWMIRKQATYTQLIEFTQANELPLQGIFYVKRKRANAFFDMGPIIKEIHQRFLEAIVNPQKSEIKQLQVNERKSVDLSKQMRKRRSKELKNKEIMSTVSAQIKKTFDSLTNRVIKTKLENKIGQQNDQNSSSALNSQTCKGFQLSKNTKKSLGSIVIDEKRVKSILKKSIPLSSNRLQKQGGMKLRNSVEDATITNELRMKLDVSPMMADDLKEYCDSGMVKDFDSGSDFESRFMKPQIYVFQGVKCNDKEQCEGETYHGKVPLLFDFHEQRLKKVIQQLKEQNVDIDEEKDHKTIKVFYFKYDSVKQSALELINSSIKQLIKIGAFHNEYINPSYCVRDFREKKIKQILEEISNQAEQQNQLRSRNIDKGYSKQLEEIELTEQQEEKIIQKTEKKLQQIKKQVIDHTISLKGRNYTFENGESIYYFVGDAFKRNYNLLYDEYYKVYQKEVLSSLLDKSKPKDLKEKGENTQGNKINDHSRATDCTMHLGQNKQVDLCKRKQSLKLDHVSFYQWSCQ